jgi:SAM-dependent methyltransferase
MLASALNGKGKSAMDDAYREDLAYIHDAGFGQFARGAAAVLLEELRDAGVAQGLVIDLACGSGILGEALAAGGYDIWGIDLSSAAIALARKRVPSGSFRIESLLTAQLPPCVAVAAVGEGVNYLFDDRHSLELVRQVLGRVFEALIPAGLLLFDFAEPGRVPGPGVSKNHLEGDGWAALISVEEDRQQKLLTRHITSFRKIGDRYRRDHEVHRLRLLPQDQVLSWLHEIGFQMQILGSYGPVELPPGLVGVLARKPV